MEKVKTVHTALANVQSKIGNLQKNKKAHKYMFLDLPSILDASRIPLFEEEAYVIDNITSDENGVMFLTTTFYAHNEGISVCSPFIYKGALQGNNDIQKVGSAITYLRRYNRQNLFNLTGDDDDGVKAQGLPIESEIDYGLFISKWFSKQKDDIQARFLTHIDISYSKQKIEDLSIEERKEVYNRIKGN